jgi:pimeloyl-ACP methyl ester carboxylesterase
MCFEEVSMKCRAFRLSVLVLFLMASIGLNGCSTLGLKNIPPEKLKQKYGTADDKYFAYKGIQVRYRDEGSGPTVILLHGVCSFLETWDGWVPYMKDKYRVIRLDMPGFGMTGPAPESNLYSMENFMSLMNAFLNTRHIETCSLVGNSLGGYMAWNYALRHRETVNKLILIDPVGFNQKLPWMLQFSSNPVIRPFSRRIMPRSFFDSAVHQVYGDKSKVTPKVEQLYFDYAMRDGNKGSYVDIFTAMRDKNGPDLSKGISDIRTPTLVMWGKKDEWIPYAEMSKWKEALPSASFITYENEGHVPMEESPEITVKDAMDFLQ